jgi:pilus assembly protein CpaF
MRIDERELRRAVTDGLAELGSRRTTAGHPAPTDTDRRMLARDVLRREINARIHQAQQRGEPVLSAAEERGLTDRVMAAVFTLVPGTEEWAARPDVTNGSAIGNEPVQLRLTDGTTETASPMVDTDDELIERIQMVARKGGHTEREFSESRPMLELELRDGSRLAAAAWVTPRPYLTIRKHPLVRVTHDDLVARGMYDEGIASFLRATIGAHWSGMVVGGTDAGKTTLLRAMLRDVDPAEWPITVESEPELRMDAIAPEVPWRAFYERPANADGEGELLLDTLSRGIKRHSPSRLVVGEVRGPEVITMLEALTSGETGGWCTMHAPSPAGLLPRLHLYAAKAEGNWPRDVVYDLAAMALDVVVFLASARDGRKVISSIRHIDHYDHREGVVVGDDWFVPGPDGSAVPNPDSPIPPHVLAELADHGYRPELHRGVNGYTYAGRH